jgi:diacylglycerol kinase (ATP)
MDIELIIHSNDANVLAQLRAAVAELREQGHRVGGRVTFEPGDAADFADAAVAAGADLVLAAGGDGTINEVVNGLRRRAGTRPGAEGLPRLGIVPIGTANDFAGSLGIPQEVAEAVRTAVHGDRRVVDLARVNDRFFVNVSTGGIGAEATDEAPTRVKRTLGSLAYLFSGVRKFATLEPCCGRFASGGETIHEGSFLLFAVGNGVRTGGGNSITPRADLADGLLDVCIVGEVSHAEFLRLLPDLRAGRHLQSPHVVYRQVARLSVEATAELSVNADGESVDAQRLEYSLVPGALAIAVPRATG